MTSWAISWGGASWSVTGFLARAKALHHTEKHFLEWKEAWEQLDTRALTLRKSLDAAEASQRDSVLEGAMRRYVELVRQYTGPGYVSRARIGPYEGHRRLKVASVKGIFAAFGEKTSDLVTAYRPYPLTTRGVLTTQQYLAEALRKVERL